ncbi:class I SAM-dependent methyltransferase [Paenibacillus sp. JX-17]|uniref:Class I SAM-dependent methyltransferase n=1 Tax=Paenibacillus lacisoli TaxID=3064525 RepID=A0ABT9CDZ8_9BACL|nr:class I SAM-dependent methyltransferase [Paenibacillus sp. JX-17]MDO7907462.1 class I SAM-dependent methyltransferase [Paenibacillus sp. JX-17]
MLQSLSAIALYRQVSEESVSAEELPWLRLLVSAEERIVNLERITSLNDLADANPVLDYVERTLQVLDELSVSFWMKDLLEEVLTWAETAKGGTMRQRLRWQQEGINLFVHNIGSAQLYERYLAQTAYPRSEIIRTLIETHGLIGQYIRGEIPFEENLPLRELVRQQWLTEEELYQTLLALNECVIAGVDRQLWNQVYPEVQLNCRRVAADDRPEDWSLQERLRRLRSGSIARGERFDHEYAVLELQADLEQLLKPLQHRTMWYVESALQDFSLNEMVKIFALALLPSQKPELEGDEPLRHISFEPLMNTMYYDYHGEKKINVYKKRMIEKFLDDLEWEQLGDGKARQNPHLKFQVERKPELPDTLFVDFAFSAAASKLIDFCVEAEKSPLYEKAVLMLFDLFGLRRDAYDRFHNEETYLADMNRSADYKKVILNYIVGQQVLDIGPGGGVLLDLIEEERPELKPVGIDISTNVIEALERKKELEGHQWEVMKGDALQLEEYVKTGSIDTVIFSSILHELYSYIEQDGSRFNLKTVADALRSAYQVLSPGGRIIIRDGIMTEPVEQMRRIRFLEEDGMEWFHRYSEDFKGRAIRYKQLNDTEVLMPVNDAMEFLYTYTWGEEAYVHEVQEQFGYVTPSQYTDLIHDTLGNEAFIRVFDHYLQEGYAEALSERIIFMEEDGREVHLPDSTCLIVIEKPAG